MNKKFRYSEVDLSPKPIEFKEVKSPLDKIRTVGRYVGGAVVSAVLLYGGARVADESLEERIDCKITVGRGDAIRDIETSVDGSRKSEIFTDEGDVLIVDFDQKIAVGPDGEVYERGLQPGDTVISTDADPNMCQDTGGVIVTTSLPEQD